MKPDPGNTDLLVQRHKLLGQAVDKTRGKLQTLQVAGFHLPRRYGGYDKKGSMGGGVMEQQKENAKKIRAAIYCRMATDNDESRGLETQISQLCSYAKAQGYTVVAEVSEVAKGLSLDRPGIRELLSLAQNRIEEILVANLSRISRNIVDLLRFEEKLGKKHIRLNTPQGNSLTGFRGIE